MRGEEGEQARWTRAFAERLAARVERARSRMHDERLTTRQAERAGGSADADSRAAAHLLEAFLMARDQDEPRRRPRRDRRGARARAARARGAPRGGTRRADRRRSRRPSSSRHPSHRAPSPRAAPSRRRPPPARLRAHALPRPRTVASVARSGRGATAAAAASRCPSDERQRRATRRRATLFRVASVAALLLALFAAWFLFSLFQPFKGDGEGAVRVQIPTGATVTEIGDILEENDVIDERVLLPRPRHARRQPRRPEAGQLQAEAGHELRRRDRRAVRGAARRTSSR